MSDAKNISLTITPAAIQHLKDIIVRRGSGIGFRLSMKKYGCNGFGYVPDVIDQVNANDIEITAITELRVFVDAKFADVLNGTVIDYVKKGVGQNQLMFNNPNAEGECGCGESVNLKIKSENS